MSETKALAASVPDGLCVRDNIDALGAWVDEQIAPYVGAEFDVSDEQAVKDARKCMADLNALKKPIEGERKRVKREYEAPLKAFEARVKEITGKIDSARAAIKGQVDEADRAFKDARYAALEEHYREFAELLAPVVPYEKLHEEKWCNRSTKESAAEAELEAKVSKVAGDWETLKSLDLDFAPDAEAQFFRTLDVGAAIEYARKLAEDKSKIEDMKAEMDAYAEMPPEPSCGGVSPESEQVPARPEIAPQAAPQAGTEPVPAPAYAPPSTPPGPCVMVIDAATVGQMREIGRFCGSLEPPVTGCFKRGTLEQVFRREREAAMRTEVVSYV